MDFAAWRPPDAPQVAAQGPCITPEPLGELSDTFPIVSEGFAGRTVAMESIMSRHLAKIDGNSRKIFENGEKSSIFHQKSMKNQCFFVKKQKF